MRKSIIILFTFIVIVVSSADLYSQCAMCRRVAETGQNEGKKTSRGLNSGILYLLAIPYVLGGVGVFFYFRNKKERNTST